MALSGCLARLHYLSLVEPPRPTQVLGLLRPSAATVEAATLPDRLCLARQLCGVGEGPLTAAVAALAPSMALTGSFACGASSGPPTAHL